MKENTKKRLKKTLKYIAIAATIGTAGVIAYKKVPKVKEIVDNTSDKIKSLVGMKKYPEYNTLRKPRPVHINNNGFAK